MREYLVQIKFGTAVGEGKVNKFLMMFVKIYRTECFEPNYIVTLFCRLNILGTQDPEIFEPNNTTSNNFNL